MTDHETSPLVRLAFGGIIAGIVLVLGTAVLSLPTEAVGLADAVDREIDQAGAKNPVTAVLLNFRGYDTMLEIVVLVLAVIGERVLIARRASTVVTIKGTINPVLLGFIRVIAPAMILVSGYLLWVGGHAPGGAFQAAAVLAALGILLKLGEVHWSQNLSDLRERLLFTAGLVIFLAVGLGVISDQRNFLEYPVSMAKPLILFIETFATVSIAAILLALFSSGNLRAMGSSDGSDEEAE